MANTPLTGNSISTSYQGLLKAGDSGAIGATEKPITDGLANASTLSLGTTSASFTGTLDLSGATVTGLPAGAAGLESGTGADSMQSAASLTTTPANAAGDKSIALGDGATSNPFSTDGVAIGKSALNQSPNGTAIGADSYARDGGVAIGKSSISYNVGDTAIGVDSDANGGNSVAVGKSATVASNKYHGIAIGNATSVTGEFAGAIGSTSSATANGAYALGQGVIAATADTVSIKALEVQTNSTPTAGGIIMSDAGGTDRRINIDATGGLQIDSTPVGGGAAGLESGTGADSMQSAASLTTTPADAAGANSINLGNNSTSNSSSSGQIGIGNNSNAFGLNAISIGTSATNTGGNSTVIGPSASTGFGQGAVALGQSANASAASFSASVAVGRSSTADNNGTAVGYNSTANAGSGAVALGRSASATGADSAAVGYNTSSNASGAVALGAGVTASTVDTVTMKLLQIANYATINFADDTAAAAGGIPLGGVYHTSGALKIRIV